MFLSKFFPVHILTHKCMDTHTYNTYTEIYLFNIILFYIIFCNFSFDFKVLSFIHQCKYSIPCLMTTQNFIVQVKHNLFKTPFQLVVKLSQIYYSKAKDMYVSNKGTHILVTICLHPCSSISKRAILRNGQLGQRVCQ